MYQCENQQYRYEVRLIEKGIVRVRMARTGANYIETLFSRYHVIEEKGDLKMKMTDEPERCTLTADDLSVVIDKASGKVCLSGKTVSLTVKISCKEGGRQGNEGFRLEIPMDKEERLFGLGDESRNHIARRGTKSRLDMSNIASYGPIPYLMSTGGWGILVNSTYAQDYDLGATDPDQIVMDIPEGSADFYVFLPENGKLPDIIRMYASISGFPIMMPKSFYGVTYIMNERSNARYLLDDCLRFRERDIPLDMVSLEPNWMTKSYDYSTEKAWDPERFFIPTWEPVNTSSKDTFFYPLRQMGFKLSLWLCMNYDLFWEEERKIGQPTEPTNIIYPFGEDAMIKDPRLVNAKYVDKITKRDEAWFEHLKKFVDNGVSAFKLDASAQVRHHPDRLWACKFTDKEAHNIYPVLYVRQMQEGFTEHTNGRRAIIFTPCLSVGTQKHAASWSGDTGGGPKTLVSMLNFGLCGHSNVACDMEDSPASMHYGFLSPWSKYFGWDNWKQPWYLGQEKEQLFRRYAKLRSSLFPYIYSMSHYAAQTAMPVARALCLMDQDNPAYDEIKNEYWFGDKFLVGAFDMHLTLPSGRFYDYFTGEIIEGGREIDYRIPENWGGALFVKEGAIFVTMEPRKYVEEKVSNHYDINIYHGKDDSFVMVDDDGYTYDYKSGAMTCTPMSIENSNDSGFDVVLGRRQGEFFGRERRPDAMPSEPEIPGMPSMEAFRVVFHTCKPAQVTLDGEAIALKEEDGKTVFEISAELHEKKDLRFAVQL